MLLDGVGHDIEHVLRLRSWLCGYLVAPAGTIAVMTGVTFFLVLTGSRRPVDAIRDFFEVAPLAILIAYIVGAALFPVFLILEWERWTRWTAYVPTAGIAGVVTGLVIRGEVDVAACAFTVACGTCSGVIFSMQVGSGSGIGPSVAGRTHKQRSSTTARDAE